MGIFDVHPSMLIKEAAKDFKQKLKQPAFTDWVKTGSHVERAPQDRDWWFERAASILYRVYKDGPVGTESLRTYYGGRKHRGVRPEKKRKSSGKIIRTCLQALEKEGLIKKEKTGRVITGPGESFLLKVSKTAKVSFEKQKEERKLLREQKQKEIEEARKAPKEQSQQPQRKDQKQEKRSEKREQKNE